MPADICLLHADGSVAFAGLPADALLATRALRGREGDVGVATARLCEHFEGHGTCNRGVKCRFAHRAAAAAATNTTITTTTTTTSETATQPGALAAHAASDATPIASSGSESSGNRRRGHAAAEATLRRRPTQESGRHSRDTVGAFGQPALPRGRDGPTTAPRSVVQTSRGWRHAPHGAAPLSR